MRSPVSRRWSSAFPQLIIGLIISWIAADIVNAFKEVIHTLRVSLAELDEFVQRLPQPTSKLLRRHLGACDANKRKRVGESALPG